MEGFHCDLLETEQGPSLQNLNGVKNLNGRIFIRFTLKTSAVYSGECLNESDKNEISTGKSESATSQYKYYQW